MAEADVPRVEIAFDCLPLRSLGRLDIPLDASESFRVRAERIKAALAEYGADRTYYLYNGSCVFRFANSDIAGACRFEFEGVVRTDAGDRLCQETFVTAQLVSETCGGIPEAASAWLAAQVRRAVGIEFDRFLSSEQVAPRADQSVADLADVGGLSGMDV